MKITVDVDRLGSFSDAVAKIRDFWSLRSWEELWFRGESADYRETRLRPALYRPAKGKALKLPQDLISIEDDLFQYFQHNSTELAKQAGLNEDSDDPWGTYFLIQHFGGPTRLLDWSDGSLIALHFALRTERAEPCDRFVFALDPYWLVDHLKAVTNDHEQARKAWVDFCRSHPTKGFDEDDWDQIYIPDEDGHDELPVPNMPLVLEFDHFARRISAQRSRFVVLGTAYDYFNKMYEDDEARLGVIRIGKDKCQQMRNELRDAGVTESVIFPDLDGLGRELQQLWADRLGDPS